jgi:hypothetical protein
VSFTTTARKAHLFGALHASVTQLARSCVALASPGPPSSPLVTFSSSRKTPTISTSIGSGALVRLSMLLWKSISLPPQTSKTTVPVPSAWSSTPTTAWNRLQRAAEAVDHTRARGHAQAGIEDVPTNGYRTAVTFRRASVRAIPFGRADSVGGVDRVQAADVDLTRAGQCGLDTRDSQQHQTMRWHAGRELPILIGGAEVSALPEIAKARRLILKADVR